MAKVKMGAAGIEYMQGALKRPKKIDGHNHGNYLVMTHRTAATTNPNCQRLYVKTPASYQRTTPVLAEELARRVRFATVGAAVAARKKDLSKVTTDTENFLAQRNEPNGKKTMKSYLWSLELAAYDARP